MSMSHVPERSTHAIDLQAVGISAAKIAGMDALLQSFVDQQKVSSVVGLVAKGGNVVYNQAFGWKDRAQHSPATVDDYYVLRSYAVERRFAPKTSSAQVQLRNSWCCFHKRKPSSPLPS